MRTSHTTNYMIQYTKYHDDITCRPHDDHYLTLKITTRKKTASLADAFTVFDVDIDLEITSRNGTAAAKQLTVASKWMIDTKRTKANGRVK